MELKRTICCSEKMLYEFMETITVLYYVFLNSFSGTFFRDCLDNNISIVKVSSGSDSRLRKSALPSVVGLFNIVDPFVDVDWCGLASIFS